MGSSMASSIRFLVSDGDFKQLIKDAPRTESIIAFRLHDAATSTEVLRAYTADEAGLPTNGPAITWQTIRLFNGLAVVIAVAGILMVVALL